MTTTITTADLLATVRERWPNALRTTDPVIHGGPWAGAVAVWTMPVLPVSDGGYLTPNAGMGDTDMHHATLESAERYGRRAFDRGILFG